MRLTARESDRRGRLLPDHGASPPRFMRESTGALLPSRSLPRRERLEGMGSRSAWSRSATRRAISRNSASCSGNSLMSWRFGAAASGQSAAVPKRRSPAVAPLRLAGPPHPAGGARRSHPLAVRRSAGEQTANSAARRRAAPGGRARAGRSTGWLSARVRRSPELDGCSQARAQDVAQLARRPRTAAEELTSRASVPARGPAESEPSEAHRARRTSDRPTGSIDGLQLRSPPWGGKGGA